MIIWVALACKGTVVDSGDGESAAPLDTADLAALEGAELVDEDTKYFRGLDYTVQTWQLTDGSYTGQSGDPPTWLLFTPRTAPHDTRDVLVWIHGGAWADDADPDLNYDCTLEAGRSLVKSAIFGAFVPRLAAARDWSIVYPLNDWCDGWVGLGEDDPVHPGVHYGRHHFERVMRWVDAGGGGFTPDQVYGWGASAGALSVLHLAANTGRVSAILADSGPTSTLRYHELVSELAVEHLFGGSPDEAYDAYVDHDGEELVRSGRFEGPVALPWNAQDAVTDVSFPQGLAQALEERGGHYVVHDYDHAAKPEIFHTQARYHELPWAYGTHAWVDFLDGWQLQWVEAEGLACEGCVGGVCQGEGVEELSGAAGRCAGPTDAGVFARTTIPSELAGGGRLMPLVRATEHHDLDDDAVVFELDVGGARTTVRVGDLAREHTDIAQVETQLAATVIDVGAGSEGELTLEVQGVAGLILDGFIWQWERASK